jgi:hypothetical protein
MTKNPFNSRKQQFPLHLIEKLKTKFQYKIHKDKIGKNEKWAIFTCHSPIVRKITNLFKQTGIQIAFKNTNTIQQQTRPKNHETIPDHNKSSCYKVVCKTYKKAYIGQTNRNLTLRFCEHIRYVKNNDPKYAYAQHILQNIHEYGTLVDTIPLFKPIHNTAKLIPYEQLFIQTFDHNGNLIDEQSASDPNPLFQLAINKKPDATGPSESD